MFLDIGVGIFVSIFLSRIFEINLSYWFITGGILFSLLPDLDVFVELAKRGKVGGQVQGHHRELTHFPLTYLPVFILVYFIFGKIWLGLFGWCVFLHFLHDSVGMGWGIKWWWPFSNKAYKFFSEKDGSFSNNFMVSWRPQELKETIARHGDDHWLKNFYFKLHPIAVFEFSVFVLAVIVLVLLI
ncbi:MAG: metal-dependent hydrolase [Patescibacteria group bacterium]